MSDAPRFCPICGQGMGEQGCAAHGLVPDPSELAGRDIEAGAVIGRYRAERALTAGGMALVFEGRELGSERPVVLKVLKEARLREQVALRRFVQEARVVESLIHPNIVQIFEFGVDRSRNIPFIAMERVDGRTLQQTLKIHGPFDEARAAWILGSVAEALRYAHGRGVLHRDLKPQNVMIGPDSSGRPRVVVLDFGMAKLLECDEQAPLTTPGRVVGTPAFMSPEQVTHAEQDPRTDLYGLGCMLHALLTGDPPFRGADAIQVMRKQLRDPAPPLPEHLVDGRQPSVPLVDLHRALLQKSRFDRPADAALVCDLLERIRMEAEATTTATGGRRPGDAETTRRTDSPYDTLDTLLSARIPQTKTELDPRPAFSFRPDSSANGDSSRESGFTSERTPMDSGPPAALQDYAGHASGRRTSLVESPPGLPRPADPMESGEEETFTHVVPGPLSADEGGVDGGIRLATPLSPTPSGLASNPSFEASSEPRFPVEVRGNLPRVRRGPSPRLLRRAALASLALAGLVAGAAFSIDLERRAHAPKGRLVIPAQALPEVVPRAQDATAFDGAAPTERDAGPEVAGSGAAVSP